MCVYALTHSKDAVLQFGQHKHTHTFSKMLLVVACYWLFARFLFALCYSFVSFYPAGILKAAAVTRPNFAWRNSILRLYIFIHTELNRPFSVHSFVWFYFTFLRERKSKRKNGNSLSCKREKNGKSICFFSSLYFNTKMIKMTTNMIVSFLSNFPN